MEVNMLKDQLLQETITSRTGGEKKKVIIPSPMMECCCGTSVVETTDSPFFSKPGVTHLLILLEFW